MEGSPNLVRIYIYIALQISGGIGGLQMQKKKRLVGMLRDELTESRDMGIPPIDKVCMHHRAPKICFQLSTRGAKKVSPSPAPHRKFRTWRSLSASHIRVGRFSRAT